MTPHQGPLDSWVRLPLQRVPAAARLARTALRSDLAALDVGPELLGDAELVMSELVANAVEHGLADEDGMIEAAWQLSPDRLVIRVSDSGTGARLQPGTLEHGPEGPRARGRGLAIVARLTSTWSYEVDDDGTEVTAVLERNGRP